jgi:hypothetical protein
VCQVVIEPPFDLQVIEQEAPVDDRRFLLQSGVELDGANLVRLGTLRALGGLELHPLPLIQ